MRPWSIIPIALQIADKNLLFDAAFSTGNNIDPTLWSTIAEDGKLIELNIVDTDGWTINLLEDGDVAFIIVDAKSKSGKKYSALELSLNYIYKMPLPREHVDLGVLSPTRASTTPVKSPQPTQSTERASKATKIIFY
jgi:hypothetical protein